MDIASILNIKIEDLGLSVRTFKGLYKYAGIRTVKDLLYYCAGDDERILNVRQCGIVSKLEVIGILNKIAMQTGENIYLGMTVEEIDKCIKNNKQVENYEFEKQHNEYLERLRKRFLSTLISRLGLSPSEIFINNDTRSKTIGYLLQCISDKNVNEENIDKIINLFGNLGLSNIYLGMPREEIDNLYISYDNISKLKSLIKQNKPSMKTDIIEKNKLESQVELKRKAYFELEALIKEKDRLAQLDSELDRKIEALLGKINYGKHK